MLILQILSILFFLAVWFLFAKQPFKLALDGFLGFLFHGFSDGTAEI